MRNRTWVLVLAMIVGLFIVGAYTGWRATRANERIRVLLLSKIRPFLDPQSDIEKLELTLGHLKLKNVLIIPKNQSITLKIKDVRIGYQMWSMLRYGFSPGKIAHEAVFIEPEVIFHQPSDTLSSQISDSSRILIKSNEIFDALGFVKRITIKSGRLYYENSLGEEVLVAHTLDGFLIGAQLDSSYFRMDGKLFAAEEKNLKIDGHVNIPTGKVGRAQVEILESEPTSEQPLLLPNYAEITSGKFRGNILYKQEEGARGELIVEDGAFFLKGADLTCEGMSFKGDIQGNQVKVLSHIHSFNGSPLEIKGSIYNILNPRLDLDVESNQFNISEFFRQAIPGTNLDINGNTKLQIQIKESPYNPKLNGKIQVEDLYVYGIEMRHFLTTIQLQDSVFHVKGSGSNQSALNLDLEGQLDLSRNKRYVVLTSTVQGDFISSLPPLLRPRITKLSGHLGLNVQGQLGDLQGNLEGLLAAASVEGDSLFIVPKLNYSEQNLNVAVQSNSDFDVEGFVAHPFYENYEWHLTARGLSELIRPLFSGAIRHKFNQYDFFGEYDATRESWDVKVQGADNTSIKGNVVLSLQASSEKSEEYSMPVLFNAAVLNPSGASLPIYSKIFFEDQQIRIEELGVGQNIMLKGIYPYDVNDSVHVSLDISDFELNSLHEVFHALKPYQTRIDGHAELFGTRNNSGYKLDIQTQNGVFHSNGTFASNLQYKFTNDSLCYLNWNIFQNDSLFAQCAVHQSYRDSLKGEFSIDDFVLNDLVETMTGHNISLYGDSKLIVDIVGTRFAPVLRQQFTILNGAWHNHPFDRLQVNAVDTLFKRGQLLSGSQNIDLIQVDHPKDLTITGWGRFPHSAIDEFDFSVLGRGDLLALVSDFGGLVQSASGNGEFFMRLGGKSEEWSIGEARLSLNDGTVKLNNFIKTVDNIQGQIHLNAETQFIEIDTLTCKVDGGILNITNCFPDPVWQEREPIVLSSLGMHLGILELNCSKKGLKIHVPGLMEKGEYGRLWFAAKEPDTRFVVFGPNETPTISGTILLSDAHITYPFTNIPTASDAPDPVMDFLSYINWDLQVVPDRDVHYVREVESAFGNIFVDLRLRDDTGGIFVNGQGIVDDGVQVWGDLLSTEGNLEFLDHYFRIERITLDYPRGTVSPMLSGRAITTVTDSLGMPATVWLNLTSTNALTGLEESGGNLDDLNVKFTTDNPNLGITEADLLASLGYSAAGFRDRAYDALGMQVENMLIRPIVRPIEKGIRQHLGLDLVRFSSMFSRNIVQLRTSPVPVFDPKLLLRSAKLMLGKYIAPGVFVTYSGQVGSEVMYYYNTNRLGLKHSFSLEYSIMPDLFLELEYMYDSQLLYDRREDKRLWIRHTFPF